MGDDFNIGCDECEVFRWHPSADISNVLNIQTVHVGSCLVHPDSKYCVKSTAGVGASPEEH